VSFDEEDTHLLTDIGFTKNQSKLYLSLLKLGKVEGKTLAKYASAPKTVLYRTLNELHTMGLVERDITCPYKFKATPLKQGLQIILNQSLERYKQNREKTEQLLLRKQHLDEKVEQQEYRFTVYEGKERIIQIIRLQHDKACESIDISSTLHRWLQIIDCCFENYEKALERNVKYRVVIDKPEGKIVLPEEVKMLVSNPNFELKIARNTLINNLGICDRNEATFNFYPSKSLKESPIIWMNHPSFIAMAQDHFEKVWKSARKYSPKGISNL
jgi:sugar-specific transcriptional regulator TrmB